MAHLLLPPQEVSRSLGISHHFGFPEDYIAFYSLFAGRVHPDHREKTIVPHQNEYAEQEVLSQLLLTPLNAKIHFKWSKEKYFSSLYENEFICLHSMVPVSIASCLSSHTHTGRKHLHFPGSPSAGSYRKASSSILLKEFPSCALLRI